MPRKGVAHGSESPPDQAPGSLASKRPAISGAGTTNTDFSYNGVSSIQVPPIVHLIPSFQMTGDLELADKFFEFDHGSTIFMSNKLSISRAAAMTTMMIRKRIGSRVVTLQVELHDKEPYCQRFSLGF